MAAAVDRRFDGTGYPMGAMPSQPVAAGVGLPVTTNQTVVTDTYGGWLTRGQRALIFGLVGMALVLGTFLPGIIMLGMNWVNDPNGGIRGACTDNVARRALATCCFFIFHAMLVIPMFIAGDRAHSVTVQNSVDGGIRSFWTYRRAHTAYVLQVVGNIIELALLIWTAVAFWHYGVGANNNSCQNNYKQFHNYMWAMLIIGFVIATASLITSHWQYTSAAIRYRMGAGNNYKAGSAPAVFSGAP